MLTSEQKEALIDVRRAFQQRDVEAPLVDELFELRSSVALGLDLARIVGAEHRDLVNRFVDKVGDEGRHPYGIMSRHAGFDLDSGELTKYLDALVTGLAAH